MSLFSMMRTGVSGMNGQANRLSTVADNIANSSTNGYKRASAEFSSLIIPNSPGTYNSGGITTSIRYAVATQGNLQYTTSGSDLAIKGDGFFIVQDASGSPFLTRAGSFVPDGEGRLINAAGFYLTGYSLENGAPTPSANSFAGLEPVVISDDELVATPSTEGVFSANLPRDAATGDIIERSLTVYDSLGAEIVLDVTFEKTADNVWQATVSGSGRTGALTLNFDPSTGKITGAADMTITAPAPDPNLVLDFSGMSQLATDYTLLEAEVNGNAPSAIESISFAEDGTLYALYENGSTRALYRIPLATVPSPDMLNVLPGNVFTQSNDSGDLLIGFPNEGTLGSMVAGALEESNVDIAQELTSMIEAQRSYTANSKVFQTGSDLLDVLVNLKR